MALLLLVVFVLVLLGVAIEKDSDETRSEYASGRGRPLPVLLSSACEFCSAGLTRAGSEGEDKEGDDGLAGAFFASSKTRYPRPRVRPLGEAVGTADTVRGEGVVQAVPVGKLPFFIGVEVVAATAGVAETGT
jgi:hypothetical protein